MALPVFNGGKELALAIQSIVDQTMTDWELLLIDDGSTDGSVNGPWLADRRIILVEDGRNLGLSSRLNQAISLARAPLFARMDHDDIAHPNRFERQVEFLDQHVDIDLLGTRCVAINEASEVIGELPSAVTHEQICARPWLGFYLAHPTWMGRTSWFKAHPYRDPGPYRCEDQELLLRTYLQSRFAALPDPLLAYRMRAIPNRATLLKTRLALMREQVGHFVSEGGLLQAGLSVLAGSARIVADGLGRRALYGERPAEVAAWDALIAHVRSGSEAHWG